MIMVVRMVVIVRMGCRGVAVERVRFGREMKREVDDVAKEQSEEKSAAPGPRSSFRTVPFGGHLSDFALKHTGRGWDGKAPIPAQEMALPPAQRGKVLVAAITFSWAKVS